MNELKGANASVARQIDLMKPIMIRDADGYSDIFLEIYECARSTIPQIESLTTRERHVKFTLLAKARVKKLHVITGEKNVTSISLHEICSCHGVNMHCYPISDAA